MDIRQKIEGWASEVLGEKIHFTLVHPKDLKNGDFTLIINDTNAEECFNKLNEKKIEEIENLIFVAPRFLNIFLSKLFFAKSIEDINKGQENFGKTDLSKETKMVLEHTQPNPFKEFHIGHLMNNAIGESVARILKFNGADVKVCSYHGDVGIHIAKAIWGKMQKPELSWGESYAYGSNNFEENKEEITEINKKIYLRNDEKINELYDNGKKESLDFFEQIYKKLDSSFDEHFFESQSGEVGKRIVEENIGKVFEESDGAIVFRGENFDPKTHTRVFLNSETLPTYEAKEVGLAKIKKEKFGDFDISITVTANEQNAFFDVVESAIGKIFPEFDKKLKHLSHGMLRLPSGKMSSRTGNVITAEALIEEVKGKVLDKIKEREFSDEEKNNIAEIVSIGAIKYSILKQAIGGDIIFDFEKSISFEGDSGPYLQYTAVRAKSVLERGTRYEVRVARSEKFEIVELERLLYRFLEVVERAGREYAPHYIVTYLTELASSFNSFYAKEKILDQNDPNSSYKLTLTKATYNILKNGLKLLAIKLPEKM